ncbi:uncharacterized protein LOC113231061 isoform X2 [Hyposmocoma kahamanoa]|uniref:uncharacterized protein LOC113231061 isoform X2 n=1 Tax=Hyposmocoma kahamanoa TaxID=1477025 RepID=UPI000E6D6A80|nr:uncharacterized protein LOC113231061 isoform X2 [Hyposmocoma kahamanoa]
MTDKWTNKTTAKFIEVYKRHQCLWNIKHGLYKNKEARDVAYSNLIYEMARTLNVHMTVKAVREKIRLQWYESMMFLKQSEETSHVRCEPTSMVSTQSDSNSITITKVPENESITITRLPEVESISNNYSSDNVTDFHHNIMEPVVNLTEVTNGQHRPILQETHHVSHHSLPPFPTNVETVRNSPKVIEEDEFDAFGRNVALQLKSLPLIYALESQEIIQRVLKEQRIQALQGQPQPQQEETFTANAVTIAVPSEIRPLLGSIKLELE